MAQSELVNELIKMLLAELPQYSEEFDRLPSDPVIRRRFLRGLMNLRQPGELDAHFLRLQDELLSVEAQERGIVDVDILPASSDPRICLWQGDITQLKADAIVNAANSALLGCFVPGHSCIDNAIHSAAGLQLRNECSAIIEAQGHPEPTGSAQITRGYNLSCRYVLHTVGPIVSGAVTDSDREKLASCYSSCLELADSYQLESVAFCCISTGVFHFPNDEAAEIAVKTVKAHLDKGGSVRRVVFNVFLDKDLEIYKNLLK